MSMREGKDERSPSSILDAQAGGEHGLQRAFPRGPAMGLRVTFRAGAGEAIKGQMRNGGRTRKMLKPQREREKGIHCSHSHSFSSSYPEAVDLGDISGASQLYDPIGQSLKSPYINSLTGNNNTLYSISAGVRFR